jgi:hypothetical protein
MRYRDPEAFRAALEARLQQASQDHQELARRRRTVAFDRFLARLAVAPHGSWVLKGGAALEFRMPNRARATRDVDLALGDGFDPLDRLLDDLAADDPFGDYFTFRVTRRRDLSDDPERGLVVRVSLDAMVGNRTFERFVVDIVSEIDALEGTELVRLGADLGFADVPVVELAVIDLRTHWAEKLSAYLRRYDDRPNTRVKDLVDLALLIENGLSPDQRLRTAVEATFARRRQHLPIDALPSMAAAWAEHFAEMAGDLNLATTSSHDAHALVQDFWWRAVAAHDPANPPAPPEPN